MKNYSFSRQFLMTVLIAFYCLGMADFVIAQPPPPPPPPPNMEGMASESSQSIYLDAGITIVAIGLGLFAVYRNSPKN